VLPYIEEPILELGPVTLTSFGLLVLAAVVVGYEIAMRRAPRVGLDPAHASHILFWTVISGFVVSHVFDVIAYYPEEVRENPWVLFQVWGSLSSFGGIFGGVAAAFVVMRRLGLDRQTMLAHVDNVAFAFPFAWIFGRAGCALRHDHPGVLSDHFLAVAFPDGGRFDLGLLELLPTVAIAALFLLLDRRTRPVPLYVGLFFALYGPLRFFLDTLRVGDARYLGWTPGQYLCVLTTLLGIALLAIAARQRAPAAPIP
jgi:phosphatidylglycerol:prolipoprotein diacylglycerol transferase